MYIISLFSMLQGLEITKNKVIIIMIIILLLFEKFHISFKIMY